MNALANAQVGKYLNEHCVATYQKVATFRLANGQKQGGNVASYFCTPDGRVLHAVAGPVDARRFLREARWAVDTWNLAGLETAGDPGRLPAFFRRAHGDRLRAEHGLDVAAANDARPRRVRQARHPGRVRRYAQGGGRAGQEGAEARLRPAPLGGL